ncbi:PilW family protein [Ferrimonas balearica]|uniref:PilW family protein n=1 Tax=Ferrimonas balearica TaxID=44012 RepID=UPI001C9916A7|nr:prepilin-type N-terminal cleavage/methylation domain-containing protein [Ferrimonas balearica]MBY5922499.1 type II secretion system GspH family protein [Ferrimonas balearica]MBY5995483.1 type II secretion system GspH family protein [Ferrimonas balearica]
MRALARRQAGLTLVELVITILVMGILALMVTGFITFGTRIYVESQAWQQELGNVRYAAQRFSREVRDALPGSLEVTEHCLTFRPILTGERYLAAPLPGAGNAARMLAYAPSCCTSSNCDACEGQTLALMDNYQPVLREITDNRCQGADCARVRFSLDADLPSGPFSTAQRYYLVGAPIQWCLDGNGDLRRNGVLMGEGVVNNPLNCDLADRDDPDCPFMELPPSLSRNNLVLLQWWVEAGQQRQRFVQEVQLENVP